MLDPIHRTPHWPESKHHHAIFAAILPARITAINFGSNVAAFSSTVRKMLASNSSSDNAVIVLFSTLHPCQ